MKLKRTVQSVRECDECGTVSHTPIKKPCPYCGAVNSGKRLPKNGASMYELLKLDKDEVRIEGGHEHVDKTITCPECDSRVVINDNGMSWCSSKDCTWHAR